MSLESNLEPNFNVNWNTEVCDGGLSSTEACVGIAIEDISEDENINKM